ncbi:MAG: hypothetical protein WCD79_07310 [Chthoniobacteraceae bacterium]
MADQFLDILKGVIRDMGCPPVEVDFETAQQMKIAAREEDARLLRQGLATPEEIQRRNSVIPEGAKLEVLDYSPSCVL